MNKPHVFPSCSFTGNSSGKHWEVQHLGLEFKTLKLLVKHLSRLFNRCSGLQGGEGKKGLFASVLQNAASVACEEKSCQIL